ncbi:MAG: hypothetical protein IPL52_02825 [Flavobacteriales bacterium]|nr:hypothetical protein [Flavobacteriales bacterium]
MNISIPTHDYCGNATGSAAMGSNAPGPLSILWSTGATTQTLSGLSAGIIWVDVVDGMGTTYSDTAEVIGYSELPLYTGGSALLTGPVTGFVGVPCTGQCNGAYGMPGPNPATVPTGPFTYTFDASITFEGNEPYFGFPVYSGFCSGVTTNYTYTDVNGCTGNGMITGEPPFTVPFEVTSVNTTDHCQNGVGGTAELILDWWSVPSNSVELYLDGNYFGTQSGTLFDSLPPGDYTGTFWGFEPDWGGTLWPYQCGGTPFSFTIYDMGPDCGTLEGDVWYDLDADCIFDGTDPGWSGQILDISPGNVNAYVGTTGHYSIQLPAGNYSVGQVGVYVDPVCPAAQPVPFTINSGTTTVDLASMSTQPMDIALYAANGPARPGFDQSISGHVRNLTVQTTGPVTVICVLDPNVGFESATPAPIDVTGNTVTWVLDDLSVFGQAGFHVVASVPITVPLGTLLSHSFTASNTLPEATLTNNATTATAIVTGSYDPNDKTARTSSGWSNELYYIDQDEWIDYTIRFQNTGTDTAFTVVITDTLDADLDMLTFEQGAASHPVEVAFRVGRVVEWTFSSILLPDSNTNEAASHGLVQFRIRPNAPLAPGTILENTANIFFDYNPPVITEPSVLVAEFSTGVPQRAEAQVRLQPNPASDILGITSERMIDVIMILAMDGRSIAQQRLRSTTALLDVSALMSGTYILVTNNADGSMYRMPFTVVHH